MERLTIGQPSWQRTIWFLLVGAFIISSPKLMAGLISGFMSILTFPFNGEISFATNSYSVYNWQLLMIYVVAVLGLNLVTSTGMLSLAHGALFGVGAYTVAILTVQFEWPFYISAAVAIMLPALVSVVLAVPSGRLGTFALGMITLGFAGLFHTFVVNGEKLTGGGSGLSGIVTPAPFDGDRYYWLIALSFFAAILIHTQIVRSAVGRENAAVSRDALGSASIGINPFKTRIRASALAGAFAGGAGALYAPLFGYVSPETFSLHLAVLLLLMVIVGGSGTLWGPVLGTVVMFRLPLEVERVTDSPGEWSLLIYGLVLILTILFLPEGLLSGCRWIIRKLRLKRFYPLLKRTQEDTVSAPPHAAAAPAESRFEQLLEVINPMNAHENKLQVSHAKKSFGGINVLKDVSLNISAGEIHALIGPNGSGKTTLLNCISAVVPLDAGTVTLGSRPGAATSFARARQGLARTFQTPRVFEEMSCLENTVTALDQKRQVSMFSRVLRLPAARREWIEQRERATAILHAVGLADQADTRGNSLAPADRRRLEFARVIALESSIVLMDEPTAGLAQTEIGELADLMRALAHRGVAILVVLHHFEFVMEVADRVSVLNFGEIISAGTPDEVHRDPVVQQAYLGSSRSVAESKTGEV